MLQALRDEYRIEVLAWDSVDLAAVNRFYGTRLDEGDLHVMFPPKLARLPALLPAPSWLIKSALLVRRSRAIAHRYEALVSVDNEADFGRPGIQYVHFPRNLRPRPAVDRRWYHFPALLRCYYGAADRIAGFTVDGVRSNLTFVNSDWTGALMRRLYPGIDPRTLRPPVAGSLPARAWEERENGIVVLGRIAEEKRTDLAIDIVRRVRERGRPVQLHVIGTADGHGSYGRVASLAREHHDWLTMHENLSRDELCRLLATQRYGLHATEDEHYGTAVAEMVAAGLIPFVPDSGGQREIVDGVPDVLWSTPDQAIDQMAAVLGDRERQRGILGMLASRKETLGTSHFMRRVREEVATFRGVATA